MRSLVNARILGGFLALSAITGCGTGDDRLKDKARIEGIESAESQVEAENRNRVRLAEQMEEDLEQRHRFFDAITGSFEGEMLTPDGVKFGTRYTFNPSLPRYPNSDRARTVEELAYELNNLYINAHVVEWSPRRGGPDSPELAFGCVYEEVRPDLAKGKIVLSSKDCNATYTLYLSYDGSRGNRQKVASALAAKILANELKSVSVIVGEKQTVYTSRRFSVSTTRVPE